MTLSSDSLRAANAPSLHTLLANFGRKMRQIRHLNLRIDRATPRLGGKPKLRLKMDTWLVQLGILKSQEAKALAQIKNIEMRHQKMRLKKQLKMAQSLDPMRNGPEPSASSRKKRAWMMMMLILIYMMMRTRKTKPGLFSALTNG